MARLSAVDGRAVCVYGRWDGATVSLVRFACANGRAERIIVRSRTGRDGRPDGRQTRHTARHDANDGRWRRGMLGWLKTPQIDAKRAERTTWLGWLENQP